MADDRVNAAREEERQVADMSPLVPRLREYLAAHAGETAEHAALSRAELAARRGFADRRKGRPEVILSEDVYVELGHPATASASVLLVCHDASLVRHGRVSVVGPDLAAMAPGSRPAFAQVMLLAVSPDAPPDPFELENAQYLMHRLPGYMVRSVPGKLWVRVGKKQAAEGLSLAEVGAALVSAYADDFEGVLAAEAVLVTAGREAVEELAPLAADASILSGHNKKLAMGADGEYECTDLNCSDCENQPVCDNLRDVVVKRRSRE